MTARVERGKSGGAMGYGVKEECEVAGKVLCWGEGRE